jgi:hypothetical protein
MVDRDLRVRFQMQAGSEDEANAARRSASTFIRRTDGTTREFSHLAR